MNGWQKHDVLFTSSSRQAVTAYLYHFKVLLYRVLVPVQFMYNVRVQGHKWIMGFYIVCIYVLLKGTQE